MICSVKNKMQFKRYGSCHHQAGAENIYNIIMLSFSSTTDRLTKLHTMFLANYHS